METMVSVGCCSLVSAIGRSTEGTRRSTSSMTTTSGVARRGISAAAQTSIASWPCASRRWASTRRANQCRPHPRRPQFPVRRSGGGTELPTQDQTISGGKVTPGSSGPNARNGQLQHPDLPEPHLDEAGPGADRLVPVAQGKGVPALGEQVNLRGHAGLVQGGGI